MKKYYRLLLLPLFLSLALSACQTTKREVVLSKKPTLELRNMQSRVFETHEQGKVFRAAISVLQDLGYAITSVEPEAGVISGNKLAALDMTIAISKKGTEQTLVRSNATIIAVRQNNAPVHQVDSAEFYQTRFFEPLSQALFLDALYDEDPETDQTSKVDVQKKTEPIKE